MICKSLKRLNDEFGIAGMDLKPSWPIAWLLGSSMECSGSSKRLHDKLCIAGKDLPTFMSSSVAARIDNDAI